MSGMLLFLERCGYRTSKICVQSSAILDFALQSLLDLDLECSCSCPRLVRVLIAHLTLCRV
jgi:hypothetical protein